MGPLYHGSGSPVTALDAVELVPSRGIDSSAMCARLVIFLFVDDDRIADLVHNKERIVL
jgi:hypothetical protein